MLATWHLTIKQLAQGRAELPRNRLQGIDRALTGLQQGSRLPRQGIDPGGTLESRAPCITF